MCLYELMHRCNKVVSFVCIVYQKQMKRIRIWSKRLFNIIHSFIANVKAESAESNVNMEKVRVANVNYE